MLLERAGDSWQAAAKQLLKIDIRDIAGRNQQQSRFAREQKSLHKIAVFGDHDACVTHRSGDHIGIRGAVPEWKIQGMECVVTGLSQPSRKAQRQLRIDQKSHAAIGSIRFTCARRAA